MWKRSSSGGMSGRWDTIRCVIPSEDDNNLWRATPFHLYISVTCLSGGQEKFSSHWPGFNDDFLAEMERTIHRLRWPSSGSLRPLLVFEDLDLHRQQWTFPGRFLGNDWGQGNHTPSFGRIINISKLTVNLSSITTIFPKTGVNKQTSLLKGEKKGVNKIIQILYLYITDNKYIHASEILNI